MARHDEDMARRLVVEQRRRLVASVMTHAEQHLYPHLPEHLRGDFREKVLDSIGTYHDFILDVLKVTRSDMVRNDEALSLLRQIHSRLT